MVLNYCSDYGSGSFLETFSLWGSRDTWPPLHTRTQDVDSVKIERSCSFIDVAAKISIKAVRQEFKMNGSDSPYDPDEESFNRQSGLVGLGPSSAYLRQKSWPAPDCTPSQRLPHPTTMRHSTPVPSHSPRSPNSPQSETLTPEQVRVLASLPRDVLDFLLRELQRRHENNNGCASQQDVRLAVGCAFCRSNRERASLYSAHVLRSGGRVLCPVLRAFVCGRCGATGDNAHTINYCPFASPDERARSAAVLRSIRSSGRRRAEHLAPSSREYKRFGELTTSVIQDVRAYKYEAPLDPIWAALEKKLML